jgi:Raf kinase inhibitor-like YbhB/YbcL family protein
VEGFAMPARPLIIVSFACLVGASAATAQGNAQGMTLTSPVLKEGASIASEQVFAGFGCKGGNVSPALSWGGAPAGTKGFAVTMYDLDAPTGHGWLHWLVFNIPANVDSLPKGAGDVKTGLMPKAAIQSRNDFGADGYGGPCPPKGDKPHRYQITVIALDVERLPKATDATASPGQVESDIRSHTLAKTTLTGRYGR